VQESIGGGEKSRGWNYHPLEILVRPGFQDSDLARRIAMRLSEFQQVGFVRHGPAFQARPAEHTGIGAARADGIWGVVAANGKDCLYSHDGHFDLLQQRTLLSDLDLVVVEGEISGKGPTVVELSGGDEDFGAIPGRVVACVGARRPDRLPSGGVPWFRPFDEDGLIDLLLEDMATRCRQRPFWALVRGPLESDGGVRILSMLAHRCDRVFRSGDLPPGFEPAPLRWPLGEGLGEILSLQDLDPEASILRIDTGRLELESLLDRLLQERDPFRSATAIRAADTHLPDPGLSVWEPKSRMRILQGWAAGLTCPERVLAHSRIQLLDPLDSSIP